MASKKNKMKVIFFCLMVLSWYSLEMTEGYAESSAVVAWIQTRCLPRT